MTKQTRQTKQTKQTKQTRQTKRPNRRNRRNRPDRPNDQTDEIDETDQTDQIDQINETDQIMFRWYVIQTKPRKEEMAVLHLERESVEVFFPRMESISSSAPTATDTSKSIVWNSPIPWALGF